MDGGYYILTFETVAAALAAEAKINNPGVRIIPPPPEAGPGCGFALRLDNIELIDPESVDCMSVYHVTVGGLKRKAVKIFG